MKLKDLESVIHEEVKVVGMRYNPSTEDYEESEDFGEVSLNSLSRYSVFDSEVIDITAEDSRIIVWVNWDWYQCIC